MKFVGYVRVSTARQGQSGLGLLAQQTAIERYVMSQAGHLLETLTEVESGQTSNRPQLKEALALAKLTGATLVIAKLDRLSRNAAFLLALQDSGVRFIATDMPDANELTVGIMALVAQQERRAISQRTREALQAAKARGQRLGNPNGALALRRAGQGNSAATASIRTKADEFAGELRAYVAELQSAGVSSLSAIADRLNARGVLAPRGGKWHRSSVSNLLRRLADGAPIETR